jgi:arabinose-5-phosphate isomerase
MSHAKIMANVLRLEADALHLAAEKIQGLHGEEADKLVTLFEKLKENNAALIFCGVGKSGIIAQKLASTFTSLGLHSFYLHPTEALHGDLGRVEKEDAIVFISKSGTTEEIVKLLPFLLQERTSMIALVGNCDSVISNECDIVFDCSVEKEACINNQAPTTSSTLAVAMGDAMAVLYEKWVGLSKEGFAVNHPGGLLGKSLRIKVRDLMTKAIDCPVVSSSDNLQDVILLMTKYPVSGCAVVDEDKFIGILVEGDIRRTFTKENAGLQTKVADIVNRNPIIISKDSLASEALLLMEGNKRSIQILPVIENNIFLGFIRLHDLLKEGFSLPR